MKKIDSDRVILKFEDSEGVIHNLSINDILECGYPIDGETEEEMEYLGTYLIEG